MNTSIDPFEKFDHPCKETCSGWQQGFEAGEKSRDDQAKHRDKNIERLIEQVKEKDAEIEIINNENQKLHLTISNQDQFLGIKINALEEKLKSRDEYVLTLQRKYCDCLDQKHANGAEASGEIVALEEKLCVAREAFESILSRGVGNAAFCKNVAIEALAKLNDAKGVV